MTIVAYPSFGLAGLADGSGRWDRATALQRGDHLGDALFDGLPLAVEDHLCMQRLLVGVGHAAEVLNLAPHRLLVQALDVPTDELLQRAIGVDLDKVADYRPSLVPC